MFGGACLIAYGASRHKPSIQEDSNVLKEFKAFIMRGNVLDLAVAVVIGVAFGAVVNSFVDDVLMQIIAAIGGQPDFGGMVIKAGDGEIRYGAFLTAIVSFLIIAFAIFLVIKAVQKVMPKKAEEAAGPSDEVRLLTEIRDSLRSGR